MTTFCQVHNLKRLIDKCTCYKNPNKPSCIDLIITNSLKSCQNSCIFEAALSDFCKMFLTVLKISFKTKTLSFKFFREQFLSKLKNNSLPKQNNSLERFQETYPTVLNSIAPLSNKIRRTNETPFMKTEK